jgi:Tfp pilus assembly protein PilF
MLTATAAAVALLLSGAQANEVDAVDTTNLSSEALAQGKASKAIRSLERKVEAEPNDPALLINLGIAHAQTGSTVLARNMFERALVSPEAIELETADGKTTDSRRLARRAMRMLERGEFSARLDRQN